MGLHRERWGGGGGYTERWEGGGGGGVSYSRCHFEFDLRSRLPKLEV